MAGTRLHHVEENNQLNAGARLCIAIPGDTSKGVEDLLPGNALVCGNNAQNAVEGSDPQRPMVWHRDTLMSGLFGLENDVAT